MLQLETKKFQKPFELGPLSFHFFVLFLLREFFFFSSAFCEVVSNTFLIIKVSSFHKISDD